jgi:uncharacterized protein
LAADHPAAAAPPDGGKGMRTLVSCFVVLAATLVAAQGALPKPAGRVTDLANVIDAATEAEITSRLQRLEDQTSHEVAVATVTSLDGLTMDDYKVRLFKEWGVGQEKADNGVLIVVAPNEREIGIEVGYGLEGVLPDGLAGQIIRESFIPRFRDNDYNGGIRDGAARVADIVQKQQVLSAEEIARLNGGGGGGSDTVLQWILIPFLGLFVTVGAGLFGGGVRTKENFLRLFGSLFGGIPLLIALVVFPRLTAMTLVPWAFFMFMIGHWLGGRDWSSKKSKTGDGRKDDDNDRPSRSSSSSSSRSSSSSSWSSGSSSSSSSSFGGGRSGGGGASGKW